MSDSKDMNNIVREQIRARYGENRQIRNDNYDKSLAVKAIQWGLYNSDAKPVMVFGEFNIRQDTEGDYGIVDWERTYPLTKYFIF